MAPRESDETPFEAPDVDLDPEHVAEPDAEPVEPVETPQEPEPDEAPPEPEPEQQDAEPQGASPEQWDERFKKSEKAFTTYEKRVRDIYENDEAQLVAVPISPGAPPGFIYLPDAGRVPEEMATPVMEFFGISREQDYEDDPYTDVCPTCKGKGNTRTGSLVPGKEKRVCPTCNGAGYKVEGQQPENGNAATGGFDTSDASPLADFAQGNRDNWGEPKILPDGRPNPNYGRQPQFKELVEPWGVTANIGAQDAVATADNS